MSKPRVRRSTEWAGRAARGQAGALQNVAEVRVSLDKTRSVAVKAIYRFNIDRLHVEDEFEPVM